MKNVLFERVGHFSKGKDRNVFFLFSSIALLSFLLRIGSLDYIEESLWLEDALLLTEAHQLGWASLWKPFSGYLHLYHRIVALISTLFPLQIAPFIFFAGWIAAFMLVVWVITEKGRAAGIDRTSSLFLILAISLQPNNGETFLNLGQSFYFLNIALGLYICLPSTYRISVPYLILLAMLSLSGPASEILAVILVVRLLLLRDFSARKLEYLTVWSCAAIQILFTLKSYTTSNWSINTDIADWLYAWTVFILFGSKSNLVLAASLVFWATTLALLSYQLFNPKQPLTLRVGLLLMLLTAGAFFSAGAIRQGEYMTLMNPIDHESRYYVLPYALAFFSAFIVTREYLHAKLALLFSLGIICGAGFLTLDRKDRQGSTGLYRHDRLQWIAFNKFRQIEPDIVIPANPSWAVWPVFWNVQVAAERTALRQLRIAPIRLDISQLTSSNATLTALNNGIHISSPKRSPELYISLGSHCAGSEYLALEADVWMSRSGWTRLYWNDNPRFTNEKSLLRFYPDGHTTMQYAFRRDQSERMLRLDLLGGVERWLLQDWARNLPSYTVPPATPPGGEARIESMRLFCLE